MIKDTLPKFVAEIPEMAALFRAEQPELDGIEEEAKAWAKEFSQPTERSFAIFEEFFGFPKNDALSPEKRRERILARLYFTAPITKKGMEEQLGKIGGIPVSITENADEQTITVRFTGQMGIPRYLDDIKKEMELIRPFHIVPVYEYLFITLGEYAGITLADIKGRTIGACAESIA
ncbi:MAG: DUF2313 domain-containing protein [Christensenellaceae bacterium]|nr:DUF2313 domain-containing protein [Christensenellaceae bacterium]